MKKVFLLLSLCSSLAWSAEPFEIPDEELPTEAVIPTLDAPQAVLRRQISFENRLQVDLGSGWLLDEPFYQNQYYAVKVLYHWSEQSEAGLKYWMWSPTGTSDYAEQLKGTVAKLQFGRGRGPENGWGGHYGRRFIYGKVSFSKETIMPISMKWVLDAGMIQYGSRSLPYFGGGLENQVFISPHMAVSLGLEMFLRQALDPLSSDLRASVPAEDEGKFSVVNRLSTGLDFSFVYLF